jgi:hypothetical protein
MHTRRFLLEKNILRHLEWLGLFKRGTLRGNHGLPMIVLTMHSQDGSEICPDVIKTPVTRVAQSEA